MAKLQLQQPALKYYALLRQEELPDTSRHLPIHRQLIYPLVQILLKESIDIFLLNLPGPLGKDFQEQAYIRKLNLSRRYSSQILKQIPDGRFMSRTHNLRHEHT